MTTFKLLFLLTPKKVSYSYQCVKIGCDKYKPTFWSELSSCLFIIANETDTGYCFVMIFSGKRLSDKVDFNLDMITILTKRFFLIIFTSIEVLINLTT